MSKPSLRNRSSAGPFRYKRIYVKAQDGYFWGMPSLTPLASKMFRFLMPALLAAPALCAAAIPPSADSTAVPDSSASAEPATRSSADSLLPRIMGPMEHVFWGEHGIMRHLGMPLTEETREKEVFIRRGMLTAHQVGGFLTLGAMTATAVTGQMIINGRDDLGDRKRLLVGATVASYFATAALSVLTPPPMIRRPGWNSISWHKALATIHLTGMIVTPILGGQIEDDYDRRSLHQISGYVTLAALTGAMLVVTF